MRVERWSWGGGSSTVTTRYFHKDHLGSNRVGTSYDYTYNNRNRLVTVTVAFWRILGDGFSAASVSAAAPTKFCVRKTTGSVSPRLVEPRRCRARLSFDRLRTRAARAASVLDHHMPADA
jgi:hypothetical protein